MGRPRTIKSDLPQRLFFRHGAYYYVQGGFWEPFGKDREWAVQEAQRLNVMKRADRVAALAAAREATVAIREEILQRANYTCVYCGSTNDVGIDHVVPYVRGGSTRPFNLVAACAQCNHSKGDSDPLEFILQLVNMRGLIHDFIHRYFGQK